MHGFIAHAPADPRGPRRRRALPRARPRRRQLPLPSAQPPRPSTAPSGCRSSSAHPLAGRPRARPHRRGPPRALPRERAAAPAPRPGAAADPARDAGRPAATLPRSSPAGASPRSQPILALLAGTPEAAALELCLVAGRAAAAEMLPRLEDAFGFYGLAGHLVVAADRDGTAARLDLGAATSTRARLLCWMPSALPKAPGWLARLCAEADALPAPGLVSPSLTYEDGSIHFGGLSAASSGAPAPCRATAPTGCRAGGRGRRPTGAAEIALVDRAALRTRRRLRRAALRRRLRPRRPRRPPARPAAARPGARAASSSGCSTTPRPRPARRPRPIVDKIDAALLDRRAPETATDAGRSA